MAQKHKEKATEKLLDHKGVVGFEKLVCFFSSFHDLENKLMHHMHEI